MNTEKFFKLIDELKTLKLNPNTFRNRLKIKKIIKTLYKMIRQSAKIQSNLVYKQTITLYNNILKSNLH